MPVTNDKPQTTLPLRATPEWKASAIVLLASTTKDPTTLAQLERQIADAIRKADACDELLSAMSTIASEAGTPGHVAYMTKAQMRATAAAAVAKAEGGAA